LGGRSWAAGDVKIVLARGHTYLGHAISFAAAKVGGHGQTEPQVISTVEKQRAQMATWRTTFVSLT
jgi:hypothetical protein